MNEISVVKQAGGLQAAAPDAGAKRVCLLVLGMHRSGTSAVARVLSLLGAGLPKAILGPGLGNEISHWEPAQLVAAHDRMLAAVGSRWDDWRALAACEAPDRAATFESELAAILDEEFGAAPLMVLKEPRICRFAPLYIRLLAAKDIDPRFVLPVRNPLAVLASLADRDGMTAGHAALLWLRHALDAEAATRAFPRAIVSYEALMTDWRPVVQRLKARTGIRWPRALKEAAPEIEAFLATELQHHAPSRRELAGRKDVAGWVKDSYEALLRLEKNPDDEAALAALDKIRAEFEQACPAFGAAMFPELAARESRFAEARKQQEQAAEQLRTALGLREGDVTALRREISGRDQQIGSLNAAAAAREGAIAGLQAELAGRSEETEALKAGLAERDRELGARQAHLAELTAGLETSRREIEGLKTGIAERDRELGAREAQIAELTTALETNRREIGALSAQLIERRSEAGALKDALAERDHRIAWLEATLSCLCSSRSWRATAPLRVASRLMRRLQYGAAGYPTSRPVLRTRWLATLDDWRTARIISRSALFNREWYLKTNPDVAAWGIDPLRHYAKYGAREGRDPSPFFSTKIYLSKNPDVAAAGLNPLAHFLVHGVAEPLNASTRGVRAALELASESPNQENHL
jgi:hypothetical protein